MMHRNFGNPQGGPVSGADTLTRPYGASMRSDPEFSFPRGNLAQTLIDIFTVFFCAAFICTTGVGIAVALYILLFVSIH